MRAALLAAALTALAGCDALLGIKDVAVASGEIDGPLSCDLDTSYEFDVNEGEAVTAADGSLLVTIPLDASHPNDAFVLRLRPGAVRTGNFTIAGDEAGFGTCHVCAFFAFGFDAGAVTAVELYMATSGSVQITSVAPRLTARLSNLTLVHEDPATGDVVDACASTITTVGVDVAVVAPDAGMPDAVPPDAGPPITGSAIDTWVTDSGDVPLARNLLGVTVEALVPAGEGFVVHAGTGMSDGTFSIPGVPAGPHYVHVGSVYLVTAATDNLDFGDNYLGRPDYTRVADDTHVFGVDADNVDPPQDGDFFEVFSSNLNGFFSLLVPDDVAAAVTTLQTTMWFDRAVVAAKSDRVMLSELVTKTSPTGEPYQTLTRFYPLPLFTTVSNTTVTLPSTSFMTVTATTTVTLDWIRSQFHAAQRAVNPSSLFTADQIFGFVLNEGGKLDLVNASAPDLFGATRSDAGDTNLGAVSFGDPFPQTWPRFVYTTSRYAVSYTAPGATNALTFTGFLTRTDPMSILLPPAQQVGATLTPATNPRIGSADAFTAQQGVGATPLLSWSPPAVGTPTGYNVDIYDLVNNGGDSDANLVATLVTPDRSVRVPPGILVAGHSYFADLAAFSAPNARIDRTPFRRGAPNAYAEALTATFTP